MRAKPRISVNVQAELKFTTKEKAEAFCTEVQERYTNVTCFISKVSGSWIISGGVQHKTFLNPFWVGVPYREVSGFGEIRLQLGGKSGSVYLLTRIEDGIRWFESEFRKQLVGRVREISTAEYSSGLRIIRKTVH